MSFQQDLGSDVWQSDLSSVPSNTLTPDIIPVSQPAVEAAVGVAAKFPVPLVAGVVGGVLAAGLVVGGLLTHGFGLGESKVAEPTSGITVSQELPVTGQIEAAIPEVSASVSEPVAEPVGEPQNLLPYEISPFGIPQRYVSTSFAVGTVTVSNFRIVSSDANHPAREGWEWRIADVKTSFGDQEFEEGFGIAWTFPIDFYNFSLEHGTNLDGSVNLGITWEGEEYEITNANIDFYWWIDAINGVYGDVSIPIPDDADFSDGFGQIAVQVPIGYDGAVVAFNNWERFAAKSDTDTASLADFIDGDTVWFRMK